MELLYYVTYDFKTYHHENVDLNIYENGRSLWDGLDKYFQFYNHERIHRSLGYKTPKQGCALAAQSAHKISQFDAFIVLTLGSTIITRHFPA